jgi:hypothetical protein
VEVATFKLEQELNGVEGGWTDLTADIMAEYLIDWMDGIHSPNPVQLLAEAGAINYVMDNSPANSDGKSGYYSLNHVNKRIGFGRNTRVRYSILYGGARYYQNVYWLKEAKPDFGMFGEQVTRCKALDWMDQAMNIPLPQIGVQTGKRVDQLLTSLFGLIGVQPVSIYLMTGDSILTSSMDGDDTSMDSIYSILGKLVRDELGLIYLQSDTTGGGKLIFQNRNSRLANLTSLGTLSNVMDEAEPLDLENYDLVKVPIKQKRVDTAYVIVAKMVNHLYLSPSQEEPFTLDYTDPNGGSRISGKDIQPQVAGTDYKFGSTDDGTSQNLNASLQITINSADVGANSIKGKVKNIGATGGYLNLFQFQGLGIYSYDPLTVEAGTDGLKVLQFDQPNQTNFNVAKSISGWLLSQVNDPTIRGARVKFLANKSAALMTAALTGYISSRWTVIEDQTGISGDWFINGRHGVMGPGGNFDMEWIMVPAGTQEVWVLGTSALGTNTRLAV